MSPARSERALVIVSFAAVTLIWSSTYLGIRIALEGFPPFEIGAIRFLVAGVLLYGYLRARGEREPTAKQWGAAVLTGGLFFVLGNGLVNVAEERVSTGLASVLVATMPLWATLFERFTGARTTAREWFGLGLGLGGVVVLNLGGELRATGMGAVCALVAPMAWALGSIVGKRLDLPRGAMRTASQMLAGGGLMALVSVAMGEHAPATPSARTAGALAYLAIFGSLIAFSAYNYLLNHTRMTVATSYAYLNPILAVALGVGLAGERLDAMGAFGAVTILAAVLVITRSSRTPKEPSVVGASVVVPDSTTTFVNDTSERVRVADVPEPVPVDVSLLRR
jgi:drug/metabolite transporter (DMT)-like permease